MKKTALTMTDSEKLGEDAAPGHSDQFPKNLQDENESLRNIIEQQQIAMDMLMRKYREHVDSLTRVSHLDVRKLFYKRYLDTIVNQANKMDEMTKMMRRNVLIVFKYEEILRQIEAENESLRALAKRLTLASQQEKKNGGKTVMNDVASQTVVEENVSTADKSVGTRKEQPENGELGSSEKRDQCTDMIPYTPLSDRFVYFGTVHQTRPAPLDVDAAFDLYVNRFTEETKKPALESSALPNITSTVAEKNPPSEADLSEESSDELESSTRAVLTDVDEVSSEISVVSLLDDSCSKDNSADGL